MDVLQLIHLFLQTFVDLQYTLKFQHLGFKPIDNSLKVDHLIISSNQLFILCISSEKKSLVFSQPASLEQAGKIPFPTFTCSRIHKSDWMSQCIRLDHIHLFFWEQPTFLLTKRAKVANAIRGT